MLLGRDKLVPILHENTFTTFMENKPYFKHNFRDKTHYVLYNECFIIPEHNCLFDKS